jgi:hypothetical protein
LIIIGLPVSDRNGGKSPSGNYSEQLGTELAFISSPDLFCGNLATPARLRRYFSKSKAWRFSYCIVQTCPTKQPTSNAITGRCQGRDDRVDI